MECVNSSGTAIEIQEEDIPRNHLTFGIYIPIVVGKNTRKKLL